MTGQTSLCLGLTCTSLVISIKYHVSAVGYLVVIRLYLGIV